MEPLVAVFGLHKNKKSEKDEALNTLKTDWYRQTVTFQDVTMGVLKVTRVKSQDNLNIEYLMVYKNYC